MSRFNVYTDLHLPDGTFIDITGFVYQRNDVQIKRGRPDETSKVDPGECTLTLDNRDGRFSPRNPEGPYYGRIGRNTQIKVWVGPASTGSTHYHYGDPESEHTVPDGWLRTSEGLLIDNWIAYSEPVGDYTLPGELTAGPETSNVQSIMVTGRKEVSGRGLTGAYTATYSEDEYGYAAIAVAVPGDDAPPTIEEEWGDIRGLEGPVRFVTSPNTKAGWWLLAVQGWNYDWPESDPMPGEPGGTPGDWILLAATGARNASVPRLKVWVRRVNVEGPQEVVFPEDTSLTDLRWGNHARLYVLSGMPFTSLRFAGEISELPPRWDKSGNDAYAPIRAQGIMRRLGKGTKKLDSPIFRETLSPNKAEPVAYWPCEDGRNAQQIASALDGGNPITFIGNPDLAAYDGFAASSPLPQLQQARLDGVVGDYSASETQVQWVMHIPTDDDGLDGQAIIAWFTDSDDAYHWWVEYSSGGALRTYVYNRSGTNLLDTGPVAFDVNGKKLRLTMEIFRSGGQLTYRLATLDVEGASSEGAPTDEREVGNYGVPAITRVRVNGNRDLGDTAIGHISVHDTITSIFDLGDALRGWVGEKAGRRIERLCDEEGFPFIGVGDLDETAELGPQNTDTVLELLQDAADADGGILYETRSDVGLAYRTNRSRYNQQKDAQ